MKVFVMGTGGQLSHDIMKELRRRRHEGIGSDVTSGSGYLSLDITDAQAVSRTIAEIKPDVVIHCAGWTAVDAAEDEEKRELVVT